MWRLTRAKVTLGRAGLLVASVGVLLAMACGATSTPTPTSSQSRATIEARRHELAAELRAATPTPTPVPWPTFAPTSTSTPWPPYPGQLEDQRKAIAAVRTFLEYSVQQNLTSFQTLKDTRFPRDLDFSKHLLEEASRIQQALDLGTFSIDHRLSAPKNEWFVILQFDPENSFGVRREVFKVELNKRAVFWWGGKPATKPQPLVTHCTDKSTAAPSGRFISVRSALSTSRMFLVGENPFGASLDSDIPCITR